MRLAPVLFSFRLVSCAAEKRNIGTEKEKRRKRASRFRVLPHCLSAYIYIPIPSVVKFLLVRVDPITSQHSIISIIFRNLTPPPKKKHTDTFKKQSRVEQHPLTSPHHPHPPSPIPSIPTHPSFPYKQSLIMGEYSGTRLYLGNLHKDGLFLFLFPFRLFLSVACCFRCYFSLLLLLLL